MIVATFAAATVLAARHIYRITEVIKNIFYLLPRTIYFSSSFFLNLCCCPVDDSIW